jgi:fatty acid amide hydrolase
MTFRADDPLTNSAAHELSAMLARGETSAEELARAHLDRIVTIDGKIGAFVAVHRAEALAAAREADRRRAAGERGPLLGVPVSIKENLDCEGRPSTLGIVARRSHRAARDAVIVRALREAGAVVLGQTNVPQLLLSHETRNPVYGATVNPWSADHAPGGSSGGEGAAIAAGLSPLGIGTDIGGSIRVPAHWCGIAGFKPSLDRWSNRGSNGAMPGQETIRSQLGPMARTVADLVLAFEALDPRRMSELDRLVPPLAFGDVRALDARALRVGYFVDDGIVAPSFAVARAVETAARALRDRGVEVVPFTPPELREAIGRYFAIMSADGSRTAWSLLEGSAVEPTLAPVQRLAAMPSAVRAGAIRALRALGQDRPAFFLAQLGEKSVTDLWRLTREARAYRIELLEAMRAARVDVLLCPPHATPAVPHGKSPHFLAAGSYSMLFNLVQFPAGVVPVGTVTHAEAGRAQGHDRIERLACEIDARSAGLPVGVQIAAPPFADERALAVMLALEEALAGVDDRPRTPRAPD